MTENQAPGAAPGTDGPGGMPFYEQSRAELKEMLTKRRDMAKKLAAIEDTIYSKESEYLESTPNGNVLIGFEPLIKGGSTAAAAQRRKVAPLEHHRVFSRSSISYNANMSDSAANTPSSSHAPTPVSSTFGPGGGSGSNHPTPTSATASGSNAGKTGGASRKEKRKGISLDAGGDSESDVNLKKVRTNFGASRK
ncbi:Chromatin modification-related protein eaf6 [Cytospora mali]|uniref:Chromatin modification-related protein EAF6 n=1 Tax=Cytospora mali TaxID=578113 RepID=A0A194VVR3_CYTMA|nr:Chromatin modification-related protein eaf6 [Valsa mali]